MSFLSPKKAPAPTPLPPVPDRTDTQTQDLAAEQRRKFGTFQGGRFNTMLSSGSPSVSGSPLVQLLGQ